MKLGHAGFGIVVGLVGDLVFLWAFVWVLFPGQVKVRKAWFLHFFGSMFVVWHCFVGCSALFGCGSRLGPETKVGDAVGHVVMLLDGEFLFGG